MAEETLVSDYAKVVERIIEWLKAPKYPQHPNNKERNGDGEIYVGRNDELSMEQVERIVSGRYYEVLDELMENNFDASYHVELDIIDSAMNALDLDEDDYDKRTLRDLCLDYLSVSIDMEQLIRNTGDVQIRITMYSNYDCINSHWFEGQGGYTYKESYFGAMIDALNLNPWKVRQMLYNKNVKVYGKWNDRKDRNGKEYVSYEHFWTEMQNSSCGANNLVFVATADLNDFVNLDKSTSEIAKVTIPKGNNCGLFSSTYGGGSVIEMELLKDFTVDLTKHGATKYDCYGIEVDSGTYSINGVYGVTNSFWGSNLSLTIKDKELSNEVS